jgi:hypothetical protein
VAAVSRLPELLQQHVDAFARLGFAALPQRFVLKHGRAFAPSSRPRGVRLGEQRACFMNAARLAHHPFGFTYCEGYALVPGVPFPIEHAWVVDAHGRAVDNTLRAREVKGSEYFGVVVPLAVLADELLRTGVYGLFDAGCGPNLPFFERFDPELVAALRAAHKVRP